MLFHILALLLPPFIKKFPHILAVRAAQAAVLITPFVLPFECIHPVFLFVQLLPGQCAHRLAGVKIILGIHLLLYQILVLWQIQVFYRVLIRQVNHQRKA